METTQGTTVVFSLLVATGLFACKSDTPPVQAVPVTVTTMTLPAPAATQLAAMPAMPTPGSALASSALQAPPSPSVKVAAPVAVGTGISPEKEGLISSPGSREGANLGEMCGGFAGILCKPGLNCVMSGKMHPDKSGICQKK
jgi:hypothetical protein